MLRKKAINCIRIALLGAPALLAAGSSFAQQYSYQMNEPYQEVITPRPGSTTTQQAAPYTYHPSANYAAASPAPSFPARTYPTPSYPSSAYASNTYPNPSYATGTSQPSAQYPAAAHYDPANSYYAKQPNNWGLETRRGFDLGFQGFYYRYREPSLDVSENGGMAGFTGKFTGTFNFGYFASLDLRYALGDLDYSGSGTAKDKFNDLFEVRGLIGRDFIMPHFSMSPYFGLGFRDLYDDNRGITTAGAFGYQRENQLLYFPLGVSPRFPLNSNARLSTNLEYDAVIHGWQESDLSDGGTGDPNVNNQQTSGFGLRGEVMYETPTWAIGPFINYWSIDASKSKIFNSPTGDACHGSGPTTCIGTEPENHTYEMGVQFRYHFL